MPPRSLRIVADDGRILYACWCPQCRGAPRSSRTVKNHGNHWYPPAAGGPNIQPPVLGGSITTSTSAGPAAQPSHNHPAGSGDDGSNPPAEGPEDEEEGLEEDPQEEAEDMGEAYQSSGAYHDGDDEMQVSQQASPAGLASRSQEDKSMSSSLSSSSSASTDSNAPRRQRRPRSRRAPQLTPAEQFEEEQQDPVLHEQNLAFMMAEQQRLAQLQQDEEPQQELGGPAEVDPDRDVPYHDLAASLIDHINLAQDFIAELQGATLNTDNLDDDAKSRLETPAQDVEDITDPDVLYSLSLYMACARHPESAYRDVRDATMERFPDMTILSLYRVRNLVAALTGVVASSDDMCTNGCHAFTGPWKDLSQCSLCGHPRWFPKEDEEDEDELRRPIQQMVTIPLGPQLQALCRSPKGSKALRYRHNKLQEVLQAQEEDEDKLLDVYDDIFSGFDIRNLATEHGLTEDDFTVGFSIDGARLYQNKKSDTWLAVWIIYNYDPTLRYKRRHILPALVIPGPNHPKNLDSFMFRSFYHLSAIQRNNNGAGIPMWDDGKGTIVNSRVFFLLGTANAIGLTAMDGRVGHHGAKGCRVGCPMQGRHKPSQGHYYAAHYCPHIQSPGADHPDFDFNSVETYAQGAPAQDPALGRYAQDLATIANSQDQADYEENRKATGLSKPTILLGLPSARILSVPKCFTVDLMHLLYLNISDLLIPLWRGTMKAEPSDPKAEWDWARLTGAAWTAHGAKVAEATQYFPSSFHRPPRNPAQKINSGYKATEFYLYVFGLGPGFFRKYLPAKYWSNFCRLVRAVHIILQRRITEEQLQEAHGFFTTFVQEFEFLYYCRRLDRLHLCRPCLHTLLHLVGEVRRLGPGAYTTQFPMERTIGDLGLELRQPATPFANLSQIAIRRSQASALKVLYPQFLLKSEVPKLPHNAVDVGHGIYFLRPRSTSPAEWDAIHIDIKAAIRNSVGMDKATIFGRARLGSGQVCRSFFSENRASRKHRRVSRNAKIHLNNVIEYGEVHFFFLTHEGRPKAVVSLYDAPDPDLWEQSWKTLWACRFFRYSRIVVVDITSLLAVVSMQPLDKLTEDEPDRFFVVEKSGLEDVELSGYVELLPEENND